MIKAGKQQKGYKKQIAKHKHQSVDRSRNRKLDSQELENASMREKIVSMNHCVSPATVGGRKEGKDELQINETEKETKRDEEDAGGKESEMEEVHWGLFPALSDTTGASVLASQNSLHHRLSPSPPESPHQHRDPAFHPDIPRRSPHGRWRWSVTSNIKRCHTHCEKVKEKLVKWETDWKMYSKKNKQYFSLKLGMKLNHQLSAKLDL